ncbi:hypothetical protein CLV33_101709 [Jejuia pallidilutea]|jgi:hypothetical protein|uniref:Uncharacterized protein n=1 Tax=Jejuia pallidilutea TaxID=504487 RepID=A0A362X4V8_9FLAO|nr:hypothetical protein [Jejuia pallidilutea]PQV51777.1 hypothetical protein CLV33_101709 [Jejuia pallidilutea]
MNAGLEHNEKQKVIGALRSATHKLIKQLQQDKIVSLLEFNELCKIAYKDDVWLGAISKLNYDYRDYSFLDVKINCKYLGSKFKVRFYMGPPAPTHNERPHIAHNLMVEEVDNI